MKTSVNMIRKMGNFNVTQRTSDGYFNASALLKQWNNYFNLIKSENKERNLDNFWKSTNLPDLMSEIAENELNIKSVDFTELKKTLSHSKKGKYGGTWMHPVLFVKFAMYLNPRFEYHVLRFVADQLMEYRNESGDLTKELNAAVQVFNNIDYRKLAKGINYIIFGKHFKDIRNTATEKQAIELVELQKNLAFSISMGYIRTFDELLNEMRRIWNNRNYIKNMTNIIKQ